MLLGVQPLLWVTIPPEAGTSGGKWELYEYHYLERGVQLNPPLCTGLRIGVVTCVVFALSEDFNH